MQKEKGQKTKAVGNIGQNGKGNFWYFNILTIAKLFTGFATDGDFVVGYEKKSEHDSWLFPENSPAGEVGNAGRRCKHK